MRSLHYVAAEAYRFGMYRSPDQFNFVTNPELGTEPLKLSWYVQASRRTKGSIFSLLF